MAYVFGNDKKMPGCYHEMSLPLGGRGATLYFPANPGTPVPGDTRDPMFVTALSFAQKDKYHLVQCFNDVTYTYAFGYDPTASLVEVEFVLFLTAKDGTQNSTALTQMTTRYGESRLYKNQKYAVVTLANQSLKGFLVGMSSGTRDPHFELQSFQVTLLAVEAQS